MSEHLIEAILSHIVILVTLILTRVFDERRQKLRHDFQIEMLQSQNKEIAYIRKTVNGVNEIKKVIEEELGNEGNGAE